MADSIHPERWSNADGPTVEIGALNVKESAWRIRFWLNVLGIAGPFLATVLAFTTLAWRPVGTTNLALLGAMYVLTTCGIEVGLHRLFAHRSFEAPDAIRVILVALGSMSVQGPLIWWVATHRRHHVHSDRTGDPHSPAHRGGGVRGFFYSHVGWIFDRRSANSDYTKYAPDLIGDRLAFRLHLLYPVFAAAGLLVPALVGGLIAGSWAGAGSGLLWGGFVRIFLVHHVTWCVASLGHTTGARPYDNGDLSANNVVASLVSFGSCWQSDHHAFPSSAKHGLSAWWQFDLHYRIIQGLALTRLASKVRTPTESALLARRSAPRVIGAIGEGDIDG